MTRQAPTDGSCHPPNRARTQPLPFDDDTNQESEAICKELVSAGEDLDNRAGACFLASMGFLLVLLVCLQVSGVINISWFLVLSPLPVFFVVGIVLFYQRRGNCKAPTIFIMIFTPYMIEYILLGLRLDGIANVHVAGILWPFWTAAIMLFIAAVYIAVDDHDYVSRAGIAACGTHVCSRRGAGGHAGVVGDRRAHRDLLRAADGQDRGRRRVVAGGVHSHLGHHAARAPACRLPQRPPGQRAHALGLRHPARPVPLLLRSML